MKRIILSIYIPWWKFFFLYKCSNCDAPFILSLLSLNKAITRYDDKFPIKFKIHRAVDLARFLFSILPNPSCAASICHVLFLRTPFLHTSAIPNISGDARQNLENYDVSFKLSRISTGVRVYVIYPFQNSISVIDPASLSRDPKGKRDAKGPERATRFWQMVSRDGVDKKERDQ